MTYRSPGGRVADVIDEALRSEEEALRRRGQREAADLVEYCREKVADRAERYLDQRLTLREAAEEADLSYSSLQAKVADGQLPNAGERGKPRVRRRYLPHAGWTGGVPTKRTAGDKLDDELAEVEETLGDLAR